MRPVRYNVAASLDGFIAGPEGEFDWIPEDQSVDFVALFAQVDTVLIGRRSYEVVMKMGATPWKPGYQGLCLSPAPLLPKLPTRASWTHPRVPRYSSSRDVVPFPRAVTRSSLVIT